MADLLDQRHQGRACTRLADLLMQLRDKQISDAFRAANYKPDEVAIFASAFKARIAALDKTVGNATALNKNRRKTKERRPSTMRPPFTS